MFHIFQYPQSFVQIKARVLNPHQRDRTLQTQWLVSMDQLIRSRAKWKRNVKCYTSLFHHTQIKFVPNYKWNTNGPQLQRLRKKRNLITLFIKWFPGHFISNKKSQCCSFSFSIWTEGLLNAKRSYYTFLYVCIFLQSNSSLISMLIFMKHRGCNFIATYNEPPNSQLPRSHYLRITEPRRLEKII